MRTRKTHGLFVSIAVAAIGFLTADCAESDPPSVTAGKEHYATYCALCHGASGEGYRADDATALSNAKFLSLAGDAYLQRSIANGRPGTTMSAWSKERGGPLDDVAVQSIMAYLRTLTPHTAEPTTDLRPAGRAEAAAALYTSKCETCHGVRGEGARYVKLGNPEFLYVADDGFLLRSIEEGRPGTPMPGFVGQTSPEERANLVALIRSWQRPPDAPIPLPPRAEDLPGPGTLNPTAADPGFPLDRRFVPADEVKAALDRGQRLIVLDARPPQDYSRAHVTGAVSVPFYEASLYAPKVPKDVTVMAYCGCPHAESGAAVDALKAAGHERAFVLDEGFGVWRERGYPVRGGSSP